MAISKTPFDVHLKGIKHACEVIVRPYTSVIQVKGTQFGYVTFEIGLYYQDKIVVREVGPFDMAEDFDRDPARQKVAKALAEAAMDACNEMMDPHGEMKTISVKEAYAGTQ